MKSVSQTVIDTVTNDHDNAVGTVLHAEWAMNRFYNTVVDNTPSEDDEAYDIEYFPIESITEPNRPTAGICKAIVGQSLVEPNSRTEVPSARFYTADPEDEYQYWQSPVSSDATGVFPLFDATNFPEPEGETYNYDSITCVRPTVTYSTEDDENFESTPITITVNKINFTVENTFATPIDYDVDVQYSAGGAWTTVASSIAVPADGKVELWYNGTDWTTTQDLGHTIDLSAVRLTVRQMDKEAYFNLIELGACLEVDLSADIEGWDYEFSMGEKDFITPLGDISSNTGQVSLWNGDEVYSNTNPQSPYYGILDKGVLLKGWSKYDTELVREFTLLTDTWSGAPSCSVQLVDQSTILMEVKPRPVLYRNIPVQEAAWRICDIVGFNDYKVTTIDETATIDIFWTDGEKTAWEILGDLARASQTAFYFDSYGVLNIKTRESAWDSNRPVDYTFIRDSVPGGQPSNIVSLNESTQYEANKVKVSWSPTSFSERRDNITPFEVVWEPEGDVVLRATPLNSNLLIGDEEIKLAPKRGKTWPWKGYMNVEGEWIEFDAKWYVYRDSNGDRQAKWVESFEEQKKLDDAAGPFYRHLNNYTGKLRVARRGLWGTEEKNHRIDLYNWKKTRRRNYSVNNSPCGGIRLNRNQSSVTVSAGDRSQMNDYTFLHHGNGVDVGYSHIGTRLKIDKSSAKNKRGGIFFAADDGIGSGYFLEVTASSVLRGKARNRTNEIKFYSMKSDGSKKAFGGQTIKIRNRSKNTSKNSVIKRDIGARHAVPMDEYLDIDMWFTTWGANDKVDVYVNGRHMFTAIIPDGSGWKHNNVSRMGLYARGYSSLTFEYVYGINWPGTDPIDSESYFDRISNGYYSTQASDWTFGTREARRKVRKRRRRRRKGRRWKWVWRKYTRKYKQRFFDDFGPIAHEMREFDIKHTAATPVVESKLYFSNTSQVVCPEYTGDIRTSRFMLCNISRENAIVKGDDERTAGGQGTISHKLFVYGRPVKQEDAQELIKEDAWAIRRRGVIEVEYASTWIQNETEAEAFGTWLTNNWSRSDSELDVEVFGNPFIEIGDVVHVSWKHIDDDFYVVGVSNSFGPEGLASSLTLKKVGNTA